MLNEILQSRYDDMYASELTGLPSLNLHRWPRNRWEAVCKVFPKKKVGRVLEIGCGNGIILFNIAKYCESLTGIELSEHRCQVARENLRAISVPVEIIHGNVEFGLDMLEGLYDVIIWADVIEHVVDIFSCMKTVSDRLAPDGILITATPNIAYIRYRLALLFGSFPATSGGNQGFAVRPSEMYDGGHLHYLTYHTTKLLYLKYGIRPTNMIGFGRFGRVRNVWPFY